MFYIATNNHYLFVGLDSLLKPYKSKKIRTIKRNNPKHLNFSAGDTIFFDDSIDVVCLLEGMVVNNLSLNIICMHSCESPANFIINPIEILSKDFTSMNINKFTFLINEKNCGYFKKVVLSPREVCVLNLSIKGISVKNIAKRLGLQIKTVYAHRSNACNKLGVDKACNLFHCRLLIKMIYLE
ncbi:helix-turn-helix transcriptional regulator [Klebsiella pneumoniae]|uniref:helix-turn-helix domain-containing protein n=2 Tax=Klebsiella pneumoniae TaxID=573 RepID=UPI002364437C|nr:helix-turn-helix transcriptional regulator [Klebsiella pneumoniae]MDD1283676.1 helix-turn-helix transcriptional regulator [Klebsiella pneumoniae]